MIAVLIVRRLAEIVRVVVSRVGGSGAVVDPRADHSLLFCRERRPAFGHLVGCELLPQQAGFRDSNPHGGSRIAPAQAAKLARLRDASCLALAHAPHVPERLTDENPVILRADRAPTLDTTWAEMRQAIRDLKQTIPADGLVVVGETWLEREWCAAAQLAGYLSADRYFGT